MIILEDIVYELPEELIAIHPVKKRDSSRLLVVDKKKKEFRDGKFSDITGLLRPGDCLVMNDTKVFHARIRGSTPAGKKTELLLVERTDGRRWKAMLKDSRKIPEGTLITAGGVGIRVLERENELRLVEFDREATFALINGIGEVPLPPYIIKKRKRLLESEQSPEDEERYQSVLARANGSVAAPTASLHFSPEVLEEIKSMGVKLRTVTLHVGPGTFKPVDDSIDDYEIHREEIDVPEETAETLKETKKAGGRIVAVGTTVVRTLETMAASCRDPGEWKSFRGTTKLFIRDEDYSFRAVDAMVTNFHMPKSTLLLLVYSFGGKELLKAAYRHAVAQKYRFLSYGDAMWIG